jgi:hypothetical protein
LSRALHFSQFQNLAQLKAAYPKEWPSFFTGAGALTTFATVLCLLCMMRYLAEADLRALPHLAEFRALAAEIKAALAKVAA